MLINYFKVALRNIARYKIFSVINVAGFSIGIACCILIFLFINDELNYDRFHKNADRIYRVYEYGKINGEEINIAQTPTPMGHALSQDFPEIESYTRITAASSTVIKYQNKSFTENKFINADPTFFKVFSAKFIEGEPNTALSKPNSVVITKSISNKYFGDVSPIGKVINVDNYRDYVVTGLIEDSPANSHFHYNLLGSLETFAFSKSTSWLGENFYTYVLIKNGSDIDELKKKINQYARNHIGTQMQGALGMSIEQFEVAGNKVLYGLQPLTSIHLNSHLKFEIETNGNILYVYVFSAIAIVILLIACINFVNLATSRSEKRAKEIGIRKTLGSSRAKLVLQFITESVLISILAVILSVIIVMLSLPFFNNVANKEISLNFLTSLSTLASILIFSVLVGAAAGIYPALFLSSIQPTYILKRGSQKGSGRFILRNGLVVFQFAISIILIIGTLIISSQLNYLQTKNLGFKKEQLVVLNLTPGMTSGMKSFTHELESNPKIINVSNSTTIPGSIINCNGYLKKDAPANKLYDAMCFTYCDYDFIKTYNIKMKEGRFFSQDYSSDTTAVVLNESAARIFGERNLVGKFLVNYDRTKTYKIIGIIKNYNFKSLHDNIEPLIIHLFKTASVGKFLTIRISADDYGSSISFIEKTWKKYANGDVFDYKFLDDNLQSLYESEQRTGKIVTAFAVLSIFIACLGLLGLVFFITEQKKKEIGIRKVLGSSTTGIIIMLSNEFVKWVLMANLIAWPIAYYFMNNWLQDFAYRINISLWIFIISGLSALFIAITTVIFQAIKAAIANPIESLKYE
jgi:putative ABC transport system permease protein